MHVDACYASEQQLGGGDYSCSSPSLSATSPRHLSLLPLLATSPRHLSSPSLSATFFRHLSLFLIDPTSLRSLKLGKHLALFTIVPPAHAGLTHSQFFTSKGHAPVHCCDFFLRPRLLGNFKVEIACGIKPHQNILPLSPISTWGGA